MLDFISIEDTDTHCILCRDSMCKKCFLSRWMNWLRIACTSRRRLADRPQNCRQFVGHSERASQCVHMRSAFELFPHCFADATGALVMTFRGTASKTNVRTDLSGFPVPMCCRDVPVRLSRESETSLSSVHVSMEDKAGPPLASASSVSLFALAKHNSAAIMPDVAWMGSEGLRDSSEHFCRPGDPCRGMLYHG